MAEWDVVQETMRLARILTLKYLSETLAMDLTNAKSDAQVKVLERFKLGLPDKGAPGVMKVYPRRVFITIISNVSNSILNPAKHQRMFMTSPLPSEILHITNNENYSYSLSSGLIKSVNVVNNKPKPGRLQHMK